MYNYNYAFNPYGVPYYYDNYQRNSTPYETYIYQQQAAREIVYEPLPLFSEVTNTLVTKVWPMADQLRFIENADDKSAAKPIMENIFNEINALAGKTFTDIGMPVARFLGDAAVDLVKLKDNVNAAHDFRIITEQTIKTMERVAPAFETGIPVFYQMRVWPWLAAAAGALGGALLAMMYDNASFIRKHSWKVADCYDRNPGDWKKIEECLLKDYLLAPEDARYCIFWLKNGLQLAIDKGWYTPKQRREVF